MLPIPPALRKEFEAYLHSRGVPKAELEAYGKWLRFYLDFCEKYRFPEEFRECLAPFLRKLEEKRQTQAQQEQASGAITFYVDLLESKGDQGDGQSPQMVSPRGKTAYESSYPPNLSVHETHASQKEATPPAKTYEGSFHGPFLPAGEPNSPIKTGAPFSLSSQNAHLEPTSKPVPLCKAVPIMLSSA